jgi:streptolysin S family bacteriocin protoxin
MAQNDDLSALRTRIADLEKRLGLPLKKELSREAAASGAARQAALQLPETSKSQDITRLIATLADRNDVVVEWSAREIGRGTLASSSCCCCCCCCESVAVGSTIG